MVLVAKVFQLREEVELDTIAAKLKGYEVQETFEQEGHKIDLVTEVRDLAMTADGLQGVFSRDRVVNIPRRGQVLPVARTYDAPFLFSRYQEKALLTILEKKLRANNVANQLSKVLFITTGSIVEARIPPDVLRRFHEENSEDAKVIFFDDVDLPNVEKLSLYGSELAGTALYSDYLTHGKVWYVVVLAKKYGYVIGLTRNCIVTCFTRVGEPEFISFVQKEVFPLIA